MRTAAETPAVLVAFDVLEVCGASLVSEPLTVRRGQLEQLLRGRSDPCLQLMEQTSQISVARDWLALLGAIEAWSQSERTAATTSGAAKLGQGQAVSHRRLRCDRHRRRHGVVQG